jgi:hypothetical protein
MRCYSGGKDDGSNVIQQNITSLECKGAVQDGSAVI